MRIFSGIQPTGRKHLGNYIGAIRQYVAGQERAEREGGESIYCVVDLHALSVPYDPAELREHVYDTTAILIAVVLMVAGGAIALVGVRNPARPSDREPVRGPGPAATAGECGRSADGSPRDERGGESQPQPSLAPS